MLTAPAPRREEIRCEDAVRRIPWGSLCSTCPTCGDRECCCDERIAVEGMLPMRVRGRRDGTSHPAGILHTGHSSAVVRAGELHSPAPTGAGKSFRTALRPPMRFAETRQRIWSSSRRRGSRGDSGDPAARTNARPDLLPGTGPASIRCVRTLQVCRERHNPDVRVRIDQRASPFAGGRRQPRRHSGLNVRPDRDDAAVFEQKSRPPESLVPPRS